MSYGDFVDCGSEEAAKEKGKLRIEGKDYVARRPKKKRSGEPQSELILDAVFDIV